MSETTVYLSLGSNLGDRHALLRRGMTGLEEAGIRLVRQSGVYETEPMDVSDQPWFLNLVIEARTTLEPHDLLRICKRIETDCGRVPSTWHGPRHLDIDVLLYGEQKVDTDQLTVPHPSMRQRRFVLVPLVEIAPDLEDPITHERYAELLRRLDEGEKVFSSQSNES